MRVTCFLGVENDLYHASKILTGLCELAAQRRIDLQFKVPESWCNPSCVLTLEVDSRRVAIDLSDSSRTFSEPHLRDCDLYFKRGFHTPDIPSQFASKVQPYGLNYGCKSTVHAARVLLFGARWWTSLVKQSRSLARNIYHFVAMPHPREFEYPPTALGIPVVHLQVRLWHPHEVYPDSPDEINLRRATLVRVLRKELGHRFRGGLIPTKLARERYPDLITPLPAEQHRYLAVTRPMLVGVYIRGLHHSTAFKFPEYLASSKCIIAEPPRNVVPVPLVEGSNYIRFGTVDECADQCVKLLGDGARIQEMRFQNWSYYQKYVRPDAHVLQLLISIHDRSHSNKVQTGATL